VTGELGRAVLERVRSGEVAEVRNIALDCQVMQNWLDMSMLRENVSDLHYRLLMMNPESDAIRALTVDTAVGSDPSLKADVLNAKAAESMMQKFQVIQRDKRLADDRIRFELRLYDNPPMLHGFALNDGTCYLGLTKIKDGLLCGGNDPYLYIAPEVSNDLAAMYRRSFDTWFEHLWSVSRTVMPQAEGPAAHATAVFGHRGAAGEVLENSLRSVRHAIELGADGLEVDVRISRDGVPFVIHDATFNRVGNSEERVAQLTAEEIKACIRLQDGSPVPTLDEVCREVAESGFQVLMVELKDDHAWREVVAVITRHLSFDQFYIASFHHDLLRDIKRHTAKVRTVAIISGRPMFESAGWLHANCSGVSFDWSTVRQDQIERARRMDLKIFVWTVDNVIDIQQAVALGVDGLITNRPSEALAARQVDRG
jgi:glycerophosphoryl diester phosphodiesterase